MPDCRPNGGHVVNTRQINPVAVLVVSLGLAGGVATPSDAQSGLSNITEASCTFSLVVTGTWPDATPEIELDPSTLSVRFVEIDTDEATANVEGRYGESHLITRLSGDYLHFMQMFSVGPLYVTTIIDRETNDGKLKAVHTRHEYTDVRLTGHTSRPEQYYGECAVGR